MSTSDRFDPIVGNSELIQSLWSFVLEVSDSRLPILLIGEDGVGKKLVARKIHATGCIAGSSLRFVDGAALRIEQLREDGLSHSLLSRSGSIYIGNADKISLTTWREISHFVNKARSIYIGNADKISLTTWREISHFVNKALGQVPRLVFGFRNEPTEAVNVILSEMVLAGSFTLTPLNQRREDISPISRYQIWSQSLKEDFQERWEKFEAEILPDYLTRDWCGNVEELLQAVKEYCESAASVDGSRLVGEINTSVSAHWLKEQFERMHEKLIDRWDHEDSMAAGELPGETWGIR